ncbi:MAG: ABC transporter permease [Candidatus Tectomicrobia bacterium]|nr:ABC transporter permease [Candidatus Tectomicrobia bacterium]
MQHLIDLVMVLTQKEMKVRYKSSFFGYLWSIGHPLALTLVFFMAFKVIMRIQMENYTLFLIAGLFPWQWFINSVNASPMVFIGNASIIKKINFPRNLIPMTQVLQDMIHFMLSIPVIVLFLFIYQKHPSLSWLYGLPVLLVIQFFMTYGTSLAIASINLFFRDLERLTGIFMTFLFYFTPVIYSEEMIPEGYRHLMRLNPVAPLMVSWRNLFLYGTIDPAYVTWSILYAMTIFSGGYLIYKRLSWKFAEVL